VQGEALDVIETADGVLLKRLNTKKSLTIDEALSRIRARATYSGPTVSIEDMDKAIDDMFRTAPDERF
jgi:hypothetical protein